MIYKALSMISSSLVLVLLIGSSKAEAAQLNIGIGSGPQVGRYVDVQSNEVFDLSYTFADAPLGESAKWQFLWGVGYSRLTTDVEVNSTVDVYSILPTIRYRLAPRQNLDMYFGFTAGPSLMSSDRLGYQVQGSNFLFNDFITLGAYFGQTRDWELSFSWRHLSNANLTLPNPGFDVPFSLSLGKKF